MNNSFALSPSTYELPPPIMENISKNKNKKTRMNKIIMLLLSLKLCMLGYWRFERIKRKIPPDKDRFRFVTEDKKRITRTSSYCIRMLLDAFDSPPFPLIPVFILNNETQTHDREKKMKQ